MNNSMINKVVYSLMQDIISNFPMMKFNERDHVWMTYATISRTTQGLVILVLDEYLQTMRVYNRDLALETSLSIKDPDLKNKCIEILRKESV